MKKMLASILRGILETPIEKNLSTSLSDNQTYPQACLRATNDYRHFNNFKRDPAYTQILEHVSEEQGKDYLDLISKDKDILGKMDLFKANDDYGNPVTFEYPGVGHVSPTTLRYVKVLSDLKRHFGTLDNLNICELGVGYGGQCRVIDAYFKSKTYCLVDIQPALGLAQRFLSNYITNSVLTYKTMNELAPGDYDLAISNYAFTELPRTLQDVYLQKIILRSKRGYITYNEITPEEFKSYKADELAGMINGAVILEEEPLTYEKNCIIVWGANS